MPDISMCATEDCPLFTKCYRAQATPNPYWQTYSHFEAENCAYFWPLDPKEEKTSND